MSYVIVVIMGKWSDYSACCVVHNVRLYSVLDTVVMMFGTLVGVFSVMWSELLMTYILLVYSPFFR